MTISLMPTEEKSQAATPFDMIGGEAKVHALVGQFYDLMDLEPEYAALRAVHGTDMAKARQHLYWPLRLARRPACNASKAATALKTNSRRLG